MHIVAITRHTAKCFISQLTVWFGLLAVAIVVRSWLVSLTPAEVTNPVEKIWCGWPL